MMEIINLIIEFFKTGLFAVGGGLATIPFLSEMGQKFGWFTIEELSTMIAVSESTPGPIGINMATYVGYDVAGLFGGLIATLSLVAPSVIIICIIANYFNRFKDSKLVKSIFNGLKPAVIAFIIAACLSLFISTLLRADMPFGFEFFNYKSLILLAVLYLIIAKYPKLHPIFIIVIAAAAGIIFSF